MAENEVSDGSDVIGFAFDGTGYGTDKTVWGGEVLLVSYRGFKRAFHLHPYRLPGGEKAIKEPFRTAISLLYETFGHGVDDIPYEPVPEKGKLFLLEMIKKNVNSPFTTSIGRLFDAVASLIGIRHRASYHAQPAVSLEQCALRSNDNGSYPFIIKGSEIDQRPIIENIVNDIVSDVPPETVARRFHNTIVEIVFSVAEILRQQTGIKTVALSGGVFQNVILLENIFNGLKERGFIPLIHQLVPPNDGGISLGQVVSANICENKMS
jgi:hydrogenase maturation protein HypF